MSILSYNGGAIVAMTGKKCVAIASDTRYGIQHRTVSFDLPKMYELHPKLFLGCSGLTTDAQTLVNKFKFKLNLYKLRENREMKPSIFSNLVSSTLYERRFGPYFVEPIVAGLEPNGEPFISAMDFFGAPLFTKDSVVAGTCSEALYGMCESLYKPDMNPDELFETISQVLTSSTNRDAFSGWGGVVYVITEDKVIRREIKGRQD
eukprot:TRINITY_DN13053_c0_g1_i1.p1 TRINITY_DN13053_c0_g1~~TRINITY_DN13053_c0_g1_i1.p1  ORF type:complete len:205 (+),score=23.37 TRINITY_DN13053_c0_g1_i1:32-646(+)